MYEIMIDSFLDSSYNGVGGFRIQEGSRQVKFKTDGDGNISIES